MVYFLNPPPQEEITNITCHHKKPNIGIPHCPPLFPLIQTVQFFKSPAVPELGIPPVPSNIKLKFKDNDLDDDDLCVYHYDNKCVPFIDAFSV